MTPMRLRAARVSSAQAVGGNTYLGRIWFEQELRLRGRNCQVIDAADLSDDALTVGVEKLDAREEDTTIVRALERHLGKRMDALVIGEIGGANALMPLICGLQLGLT